MTVGPLTAPVETAPSRGRRSKTSRGWWTATAIVLLPALIPPISLGWQVLTRGTGTTLPLDRLLVLFASTVGLTIAVTATALSIGTTTAWLTNRTDIPARKVWMILAALPLVIPSYMAALTIIGATGPNGLISSWLRFEIPTPYGFVGAWLALSIFLAPMAHLIVSPALRLIDPATEEAATGLGADQRRVFFTVTLPQLRPVS
jgi:iron(III) transport system permease protein